MKKILLTIIVMMVFCFVKAQKNPFQRVNIPDSIFLRLEEAYTIDAKDVNAGRNVINLSNSRDFVFKNGIYSFKGQGPHYPRKIFIFNNDMLFIFNNEGAFNPKDKAI